jgi:hypothetical protein
MVAGGVKLLGTAEKAGALTKGVFGPGGSLAKIISGIKSSPLHNVARSQAPGLAEAFAYGVFGTTLDLGRKVLQEEAGDPTKAAFYGTIVRDFGVNAAMDLVGWNIARGLSTLVRTQVKAVKGFKVAPVDVNEETVKAAFRASDDASAALKVANPKIKERLLADEARNRVSEFDPKSATYFSRWAETQGFEATFLDGNRVTLTSKVDPAVQLKSLTRRDAAIKLAELQTAGQASGKASADTAVRKIATAPHEANVLRENLVGTLSASAKPEDVLPLITPTNGVLDEANVRVFAKVAMRSRGMPDEAIAKTTVRLADGNVASQGVFDIVLPKTLATYGDEVGFLKRLQDGIDKAATSAGVAPNAASAAKAKALLDTAAARKVRAGATTPEALDFVARRNLDSHLRDSAKGGFDLVDTSRNVVAHFDDIAAAQRGIYSALVGRGQAGLGHLNAVVQTRSGMRLTVEEKPLLAASSRAREMTSTPDVTTRVYRLTMPKRRADGSWTSTLVDEAESLETLLARHPDADPRLPSTFAPRTYVLDEGATTIVSETNLVTGKVGKLMEFTNAFDDTLPTEVLVSTASKRIVQKAKGEYELVNDALGIRESFTGRTDAAAFGRARKALATHADAWTEASDALAMKGLRADITPEGTLVAYGPTGVEATFESLDALRAWHAKTPMPTWIGEILGTDFLSAAARDVDVDDVIVGMRKAPRTAVGKALQSVWAHFETFFGPSEMSAAEHAILTGDQTAGRVIRQARNGVRLVDGAESRVAALLKTTFEGANEKMRIKIDAAARWPAEVRAARWQKLFGEAMPEQAKSIIEKQRAFYDGMFDVSGIDSWKFVNDYLPTIKKFMLTNADFVVDGNPATYLAKAAFKGGLPKEFELFASKVRGTDLARMALLDDALEVASAYSHAVLRAKYLNPVIDDITSIARNMPSDTPHEKFILNFVDDTLGQLKGAPRSRSESMLRLASQKMALGVTEALKKRFPNLIDPRATPGDLVDALHRRITLSTQATKPWTPLRNWFQVVNLSAVFDSATPYKVAKELLDNPKELDALVKRMTRSGGATLKLPDESVARDVGLWQRMMRLNENTDVLTRAVAWRTAENWYDDAIKRFRNGVIDLKGFARETRLQLLNGPDQEVILAAAKAGADDVAKDAFGNAVNALTMYDYSAVAKPMAARGFMGKLFGKFMTYPSSTIALYGRMLTSGSKLDRIAMIGRLVASTTITYEAFKAAGIDYKGFQWTDPFGFQGGPLWSILVDGTDIIGDTTQAKANRASILRSLPKLLSPTYSFAVNVARAFAYLDEGKTYEAALALNGSPLRKDLAMKFTAGLTPAGLLQAEPK